MPLPRTAWSVPVLTRSALLATIEDRSPDHAAALFQDLDDQGIAAWRECAVLLTQLAVDIARPGEQGAGAVERVAAWLSVPSPHPPVRAVVWTLAKIKSAASGEAFLMLQPDETVRAVTRHQFCTVLETLWSLCVGDELRVGAGPHRAEDGPAPG
ncbi:hypothetical protein [Streptomyces griseofuscus]|uniref:hypothetical protein n=1 Tax=Streptomyces griseofuscus TaxID=146922 RepID=UPI0033DA029B